MDLDDEHIVIDLENDHSQNTNDDIPAIPQK